MSLDRVLWQRGPARSAESQYGQMLRRGPQTQFSASLRRTRKTASHRRSILVWAPIVSEMGLTLNSSLSNAATGDDNGKPYVLPSVRDAEEEVVASKLDKEYAGITGVPAFTKAAAKLAYGAESLPFREDRIAITQSISGTGALRIGGGFFQRFYPHGKTIYIPTPSWANHNAVFKDSGLKVEKYKYYNKDTIGLDFDGMIADLKAAPENSIILLHACAHNPTGIDPTEEQWKQISTVMKEKQHYPFFDMAYQGFASGDTDKDAFAVRHFIKEGHGIALSQSFAKNMVCSFHSLLQIALR